MGKKLVAILLAASMVVSSSMTVLAAEADSTASGNDAESVTAAADDGKLDFQELLDAYISKVEEALGNVDLKEKTAEIGKDFSEEGTLFTLFEDILADIAERRSEEGAEEDEAVSQAIKALASLEDADEDELDSLIGTALLALAADEAEEEPGEDLTEDDDQDLVDISNALVTFIIATAKDNDLIAAAVEETESKLFDTLSDLGSKLEAAINDERTMDLADDDLELPFDEFEEEITDVTDYVSDQDGPKQAALDVLELLHGIIDELHFNIDGHTHEGEAAEAE